MIAGLVQILLWQGLGELISHEWLTTIPGPVIGLVLLLAFLIWRDQVPDAMAMVADGLSQHLGLLFVPAATGVILFLPQLKEHALAVFTALIVSVITTVAVTVLVLRLLSGNRPHE